MLGLTSLEAVKRLDSGFRICKVCLKAQGRLHMM